MLSTILRLHFRTTPRLSDDFSCIPSKICVLQVSGEDHRSGDWSRLVLGEQPAGAHEHVRRNEKLELGHEAVALAQIFEEGRERWQTSGADLSLYRNGLLADKEMVERWGEESDAPVLEMSEVHAGEEGLSAAEKEGEGEMRPEDVAPVVEQSYEDWLTGLVEALVAAWEAPRPVEVMEAIPALAAVAGTVFDYGRPADLPTVLVKVVLDYVGREDDIVGWIMQRFASDLRVRFAAFAEAEVLAADFSHSVAVDALRQALNAEEGTLLTIFQSIWQARRAARAEERAPVSFTFDVGGYLVPEEEFRQEQVGFFVSKYCRHEHDTGSGENIEPNVPAPPNPLMKILRAPGMVPKEKKNRAKIKVQKWSQNFNSGARGGVFLALYLFLTRYY